MESSDASILVLFGSQTGAAKSIAEALHADIVARGYAAVIAPLNDYARVGFIGTPLTIVISSTTGNGDPPNNAEE